MLHIDARANILECYFLAGIAFAFLLLGGALGWHLDREDKGKAKIYPGVAAAYVIEENHVYLKAAARYAAAAKVYEELFGEDCPQALEARAKQAEAQEHIQQLEPQEKDFQDKSWPDVFHFSNSKTRFIAEMKKRHPLGGLLYVYSSNLTRPHRVLQVGCRFIGLMGMAAVLCANLHPKRTCDTSFGVECADDLHVVVPLDVGAAFAVAIIVLVATTPITSLLSWAVGHVAVSASSVARWRQCEKMENVHSATRNLRVYTKTHNKADDNMNFQQQQMKKLQKWWDRVIMMPKLQP